jgi:hypothetical protein
LAYGMHSKTLICCSVWNCKNYLYLLANWVDSETFIYEGAIIWKKNMYIYWPIECTSKP